MNSEEFIAENPTVPRQWVERFLRNHQTEWDAELNAFQVSPDVFDAQKVIEWMGY